MQRFSYFLFLFFFVVSCGSGSGSSNYEEGEEFAGGETTVFTDSNTAFSQSAANLSFNQEIEFKVGNSFFEQDWVEAPSSTTARDGLGPFLNANSCASCHIKDGRGAPPDADPTTLIVDEEAVALLIRLSIAGDTLTGEPAPDPNYGGQFHPRSVLGVDAEGSLKITYEELPGSFADGETFSLYNPTYTFEDLAYGDFDSSLMISPRVAQSMIGMGLLEAIDEEDILANVDSDDADGDGISGRPNYVWSVRDEALKLGRFGWKANQPSVEQQVAGAFIGDIGITSSLFTTESCTETELECLASPNGGELEIEDDVLEDVVFYSKTLAVPGRRDYKNETVLHGKKIFTDLGCASCHTPSFTTSANYEIDVLVNQKIFPYTDLLLHDMGEALADNRPDFDATGTEWRTAPLWGLGLIETVNSHTKLMHDGRARNVTEAILWHGGEAETSKDNFKNLDKSDRDALILFLGSL